MKNQLMFTLCEVSRAGTVAKLWCKDTITCRCHVFAPILPFWGWKWAISSLRLELPNCLCHIKDSQVTRPTQMFSLHLQHFAVAYKNLTGSDLFLFIYMGAAQIKNNTLHRFKHFIRQEAATSARFCCMGGNTHLHRSLAWTPASFY